MVATEAQICSSDPVQLSIGGVFIWQLGQSLVERIEQQRFHLKHQIIEAVEKIIERAGRIADPPRDFSRGHSAQSALRDDIMRRPDDELAKLLGSVRRSAPHEYA